VVRTQIQLTPEQARSLRKIAREEGISLAELIRRFVDRALEEGGGRDRTGLYARAATLVGQFSDRRGAKDLSESHDRYLEEAYE
jgi:adenylylsulfate kinase-like enzyme